MHHDVQWVPNYCHYQSNAWCHKLYIVEDSSFRNVEAFHMHK